MDSIDSLLCEEEMIGSPWSDKLDRKRPTLRSATRDTSDDNLAFFTNVSQFEDEETFCFLIQKEHEYVPDSNFATKLQHTPLVCHRRSKAVRWILKARRVFNFTSLTATLSVNYLDRYLEKSLSKSWKPWMFELLAIACLSIAAKLEEVEVPPLLDLQIDGLEHAFEPATIQRMELSILSTLKWKLKSVTSFAFVERIMGSVNVGYHTRASLLTRITELLLGTLAEVEFLDFRVSVIAISAICCALEEAAPLQSESFKASLLEMVPVDKAKFLICYGLMEELVVDPPPGLPCETGYSKMPLSPVTVVPEASGYSAGTEISEDVSDHDKEAYQLDPKSARQIYHRDCTSLFSNSRKRKMY